MAHEKVTFCTSTFENMLMEKIPDRAIVQEMCLTQNRYMFVLRIIHGVNFEDLFRDQTHMEAFKRKCELDRINIYSAPQFEMILMNEWGSLKTKQEFLPKKNIVTCVS